MTAARKDLVDPDITRYYHCISRCVRHASLCGPGFEHRKQWIEQRLELLSRQFAISVCSFAVMDNHLHVLVRLDPKRALKWTDREVVRRWAEVHPPKKVGWENNETRRKWIAQAAQDAEQVARWRTRLANLGWFMKCLKEPLSRLANKEDQCTGTFWEGRYKSIALLDEESLLAACTYIDLNPVAAGTTSTPESSPYTSVRQRVQHALKSGKLDSLQAASEGSISGSRVAGEFEESHWLCPFENRCGKDSDREGMLENFPLGSYLLLLDYTSRLHRPGKAQVSAELPGIMARLGISVEFWVQQQKRLHSKPRLQGSYFAASRDRLREAARRKGVHHLDNVVSLARGA